jgi:hypothetical protein
MLGRRFWLGVLGTIALAFLLTSTILFWLQVFQRAAPTWHYIGSSFGYFSPDYDPHASVTMSDVNDLSLEERNIFEGIIPMLERRSNTSLYMLKGYEDICGNMLVNCSGLPSIKVKPFIDAILAARTATETFSYFRFAILIAAGSLFVAFLALIFSALTYWRKKPS